ncbi:hypothetical protein BSKO_08986 [Bryopsis sp. KO-2023]|nr:hypothetical protein BSKO_08986 [Bryopsis sp. KO-2023]
MARNLVLVTGGNRGLGFEICKKLVASGSDVLLAARNPQAGKDASARIEADLGKKGACIPVILDQSIPSSIDNLVDAVKANHDQQITALFNNAGIMDQTWDKNTFDLVKMTNFTGPVTLTQKLAPHLSQGCRVVMMSSGLGELRGFPSSSSYLEATRSAKTISDLEAFEFSPSDAFKSGTYVPTYRLTKGMLNRATQLLAKDPYFVSKGITVNACCPGWCRTDMGGSRATKSPEQGADSALWFLNLETPVNGEFRRSGELLDY